MLKQNYFSASTPCSPMSNLVLFLLPFFSKNRDHRYAFADLAVIFNCTNNEMKFISTITTTDYGMKFTSIISTITACDILLISYSEDE